MPRSTEPTRSPRLRFDFAAGDREVPMTFEHPAWTIEAWRVEDVRRAMNELERAVAEGWYAAGFVTYEAAPAFDSALVTRLPGELPLLWFGVFSGPVPTRSSDETDGPSDTTEAASVRAPDDPLVWKGDVTPDEYRAAIDRVRADIAAGDSYQSNYTFRLRTHIEISRLPSLYRQLVAEQSAPYSAFLDLGRWQVLSLSPELFFEIRDGVITTRPMKGTAPRGLFREDDQRQREALQHSEKNRAENVMIADLARNDVGRIAEIGSVTATSLFGIERYPAVFQMVSTVEGRVRADASLTDVFAALFPAGSITGAPKTSSMRLIAEIEKAPRALYCGTIGFIEPGGHAVFNVAIRTAVVDRATGDAEYGVGGGITWDSTPGDEYAEALSKASFLDVAPAFDLLETTRIEDGRWIRLDRHLARMEESAAYFDFRFNRAAIVAELAAHADNWRSGVRRGRVLLSRAGGVRVESQPLAPASAPSVPVVALSTTPVSSRDRFLFHKTTRRQVYDERRAEHAAAFDVLLRNERDDLTEFTIGNVVVELDGVRWTPPRAAGLLAGVFRAELLEAGIIQERTIATADLPHATGLWLINSLREWVAVTLEKGWEAAGWKRAGS